MTGVNVLPQDIRDALEELAPDIASASDQAEEQRTVPRELIEALRQRSFFRLWVPEEFGGRMVDLTAMAGLVEQLSRIDGAVGWTVMIGATGAAFAGHLPQESCRGGLRRPNHNRRRLGHTTGPG